MKRPTVLVTGDCQALEVVAMAYRLQSLAGQLEFVHLNCGGFGDGVILPTEDQLRRCIAYWRQDTDASPLEVDRLCAGIRRVTFPSVALGVYLPFQVFDPLRVGHTWMGDRILIQLEESGLPIDEIPAAYVKLSHERLPHLFRLAQAQMLMMEHGEEFCDIHPSRFVHMEMLRRRLFWDYDHAASPMIAWLLSQLLKATWPDDLQLCAIADYCLQAPEGELNAPHPWQAPVPAAAAERLGLDWVKGDSRYLWCGEMLSEDEYLRLYAAERRAARVGRGRVED
jgi:hypothetical protein